MNLLRRSRCLLPFALLAWAGTGAAVTPALPEADLKAGLVFNFARYVEAPAAAFAGANAPYVICLMGRDAYRPAFSALEGKLLKGRVVKVRTGVAVEDTQGCHAAFVGEVPPRGLAPALRSLAARGVLTVSDLDGFIDSGGAIGIVPGEERLQFEINRDALDSAHLTASSQLLKLARALIGRGR